MSKNTICLWYNHDAEEAAQFYAKTFPNSSVDAVHKAPTDFPGGKAGQVLTVQFTVCGVPCIGLNGGDTFKHSEAFSFQTTRRRPTVTGTRSSAMAALRAPAAGARTNGACRGRSPRAF